MSCESDKEQSRQRTIVDVVDVSNTQSTSTEEIPINISRAGVTRVVGTAGKERKRTESETSATMLSNDASTHGLPGHASKRVSRGIVATPKEVQATCKAKERAEGRGQGPGTSKVPSRAGAYMAGNLR